MSKLQNFMYKIENPQSESCGQEFTNVFKD